MSVSNAIIPYQDPWDVILRPIQHEEFSAAKLANEILSKRPGRGRGRQPLRERVSVIDMRRLTRTITQLKNSGLGSHAIRKLLKAGTFASVIKGAAGRGSGGTPPNLEAVLGWTFAGVLALAILVYIVVRYCKNGQHNQIYVAIPNLNPDIDEDDFDDLI